MPTFNSYNVNFLHSNVIEDETLASIVMPKGPTMLTLFGEDNQDTYQESTFTI